MRDFWYKGENSRPSPQPGSNFPFSILSQLDKDAVLILTLITLLRREKADEGLIMALMYILT
ncbi:MAG: hypothetical protein PUB43_06470 [Oscillospiraceae bacterium]|nr:hypothetical protein [Oscillospiraceae bacterium]